MKLPIGVYAFSEDFAEKEGIVKKKLGKNIENSFIRPFVSKKNGKYQMSFVIKYKNQTKILEFCKEFVKVAHKISKLSIHFDIDPLNY